VDRGRLEAFSDGVFAIIITIMVLDLRVPAGTDLAALRPLLPVFLTYVLSFVYIGIYWNNHHHLLKAAPRISAGIMWANLFLLFCLSLFPLATGWAGENHFAALPTALYGLVLFSAGAAYWLLQTLIVAAQGGRSSELGQALGSDWKGKLSVAVYAVAVAVAFVAPGLAAALYVVVAAVWLVPDRRLARLLESGDGAPSDTTA